MEKQPVGPLLQTLLAAIDRTPRTTIDFLIDINRSLQQRIGYVIRLEPGIQTCEETLGKALGSCRDSAWLLVQILRHLGFAARVDAAKDMVKEGIAAATRPVVSAKNEKAENISLRAAFSLLDAILPEISDLLSRAYFTHALARRA